MSGLKIFPEIKILLNYHFDKKFKKLFLCYLGFPNKFLIKQYCKKIIKLIWEKDNLNNFLLSNTNQKQLPIIEISLTFCDDSYMQKINFLYRKKNKTTDVLSFPIYDFPKGWGTSNKNPYYTKEQTVLQKKILKENEVFKLTNILLLGDIIISYSTCIKQAKERKFIKLELKRLLIHAILHLFGFDHEKGKNFEILMQKYENEFIKKIK